MQRTKRSDETLIDSGGNVGCEKTWLDARKCKHEREILGHELGARFICGNARRDGCHERFASGGVSQEGPLNACRNTTHRVAVAQLDNSLGKVQGGGPFLGRKQKKKRFCWARSTPYQKNHPYRPKEAVF